MPTSNETRVRVEALWKIMPSVRPGQRRCGTRRVLRCFERETEVEQAVELLAAQVPRAQKSRPASEAGGAGSPFA